MNVSAPLGPRRTSTTTLTRARTDALTRWWLRARVALLSVAAACSTTVASREAEPPGRSPSRLDGVRGLADRRAPAGARGWFQSGCELPIPYLRRIRRGYLEGRSPDIIAVPRAPNYFGGFTAYSHTGPWGYVQRVPLVLYGPGFIRSRGPIRLHRRATVADLAPTIAELVGAPRPRGPGRPLWRALVPAREREAAPKLVATVVWDGGGWDVLRRWPGAWPNLATMMREGTSVRGAVVGSSPSVTPAVHATIGTGVWPRAHGIVDISLRIGPEMRGAYAGMDPQHLVAETVADRWDRLTGNRAEVGMIAYKGWHLGMIGHGAARPGGDRDVAVIIDRRGQLVTNTTWYSLPPYLHDVAGFARDVHHVDAADGRLDSRWMGHDMLDEQIDLRHTPVWALYQTRLIKTLLAREGFGADGVTDLFYTNFKQVDEVGHDWNMLAPEVRDIVSYTDRSLGDIKTWLDRRVGRRSWVLALTADHGQTPDPLAVGAWPIHVEVLEEWIGKQFDVDPRELFDDERPLALWLDRATLRARGLTAAQIADRILGYRIRHEAELGQEVPPQYERRTDERLFAAAFPGKRLEDIWRCAQGPR